MPTMPGPLELLLVCLLGGGALLLLAVPLVALYFSMTTSKRTNSQVAELRQELQELQRQMHNHSSANDKHDAAISNTPDAPQ